MYRSMLVALKPTAMRNSLIEYAVSLAARRNMRIEGLAVVDPGQLAHPEPVPMGASAYKVERDERLVAEARQRAAELAEVIVAAAREKGVACRAKVVEGDGVAAIGHAALSVDLLVCSNPSHRRPGETSRLTSILKHVPRPALVVPSVVREQPGILISYDGSFQAARALNSFACSGLAAGDKVTALAVQADLDRAQTLAREAIEFLSEHGVSAEPLAEKLEGSPGRQILQVAQRLPVGLIVMGAFGKSVVREFFFGSVTKEVLRELPVPVFLDH